MQRKKCHKKTKRGAARQRQSCQLSRRIERLEIKTLGLGGDGIGIENNKQVYVPGALPGDIVNILAKGARGHITEFVKKSDLHQIPPCPHFKLSSDKGRAGCGGCTMQHVTPYYYATWKGNQLKDVLMREGFNDVPVRPILQIPSKSRRRASFSIRSMYSNTLVGFTARNTHHIVDIPDCVVLTDEISALRDPVRDIADILLECLRAKARKNKKSESGRQSINSELTRANFKGMSSPVLKAHVTQADNGFDLGITGAIDDGHLCSASREKIVSLCFAANIIRLTLNGVPFLIRDVPIISWPGGEISLPVNSFLQASKCGEQILQKIVCEALQGVKNSADLFSGCGTFSLALAPFSHVCAYESDEAAVTALRNVRIKYHAYPITVLQRDLFDTPLTAQELAPFDAVVFDPPRAGALAQSRELSKSTVKKVVAVSCNPKTFARDAAVLTQGGYQMRWIQGLDQFLYSAHLEVVAYFERN